MVFIDKKLELIFSCSLFYDSFHSFSHELQLFNTIGFIQVALIFKNASLKIFFFFW